MSTTPVTTSQLKTALAVVLAVSETIRELGEVSGGALYATLMAKGIDFQTYEKIIGTLTATGLVEKQGHLLRWVGPTLGRKGDICADRGE